MTGFVLALLALALAPGAAPQAPSPVIGAHESAPGAQDDTVRHSVSVRDDVFEPLRLTITVDDHVVWVHQGERPHTVTADDGSFDSHPTCPPNVAACMAAGESFERHFDEVGTFAYHCKLHGGPGGQGMSGTVEVRAAPGGAPDEVTRQLPGEDPPGPPPPPGAIGSDGHEQLPLPVSGGRSWVSALGLTLLLGALLLSRRR